MGVEALKKTENGTEHLVVISYDAFSEDNWEAASRLPNLAELINNGAYNTKLKSVYPTLTYVAHTTMVTGVNADKHGVLHNNPLQPFIPEEDQNWFWFRRDVKVPTIYDAAGKSGMKTAAILWPVTGKAAIKYNIPEIKAVRKENQALKVLKNGSPLFTLGMEMRFGKYRKGTQQPYLDDFTSRCASDTIRRRKPGLLMLHFIELDDAKHRFGTDSPEVGQAIMHMDRRIGEIMAAVREAGILKDTTFIVLGDHGQINTVYLVRLNKLFKEEGLIEDKGGSFEWRAYLQSAGGSAYLHIRQGDADAEKKALAVLEKCKEDDRYGIERLYSGADLRKQRIHPSVRYMLEAKAGYCFDDELEGPVIEAPDDHGQKRANHGYHPDKPDYRCALIVSGERIEKGPIPGEVDMTDIAPTMARILRLPFDHTDGRPLEEIFRN